MEIGIENCRVKPVAPEASSQVESPASTKNRADDRHVQIDTGSRVRKAQSLIVNDICQQHVIEMAPVAWHVNDLLVSRNVVKSFDVTKVNAVVYPIPKPAKKKHGPLKSASKRESSLLKKA